MRPASEPVQAQLSWSAGAVVRRAVNELEGPVTASRWPRVQVQSAPEPTELDRPERALAVRVQMIADSRCPAGHRQPVGRQHSGVQMRQAGHLRLEDHLQVCRLELRRLTELDSRSPAPMPFRHRASLRRAW